MRNRSLLILLAVWLAMFVAGLSVFGPKAFGAEQSVRPFIVGDDDMGGIVETFAMWYRRLRASGIPVVVRRDCVSACTLVLTLPREQVCVEPSARLGFHMTRHKDDNGHMEESPDFFRRMVRHYYPQAVQDWLVQYYPLHVEPIVYMDAETIVELGVFPSCVS